MSGTGTRRLTMAQALVEFLASQHSERDGQTQRLFAGCFGIFGHGNVAGVGQALRQYADRLPYHMARNEQSMVHIASGYAYPEELFARRVWHVARPVPEPAMLARAVEVLRWARKPLLVAGGGVIYSEATEALLALVEANGIPVAETYAGKGSMPYDHPSALGAIGVTGTDGANAMAREADVVLGVGTRWADFVTASHSIFTNPEVRFVNLNVAPVDAFKHAAIPVVADAREGLEALAEALAGWRVDDAWRQAAARHNHDWDAKVERVYRAGHGRLPSQGEVIGAVNDAAEPRDVVVCAAGSMPADLHKLWRTRDPKQFHLEYGNSCMGYEIPGAIGIRMADPGREVFAMVGDAGYLMSPGELVTAVAEGVKIIVVLVQNHGYASIGSLSEASGNGRFGTRFRHRQPDGGDGDLLPVDLAANAASLGATVLTPRTVGELADALKEAREADGPVVVHVETDPLQYVTVGGAWWDVAVAEVSDSEDVRRARAGYQESKRDQRYYL